VSEEIVNVPASGQHGRGGFEEKSQRDRKNARVEIDDTLDVPLSGLSGDRASNRARVNAGSSFGDGQARPIEIC
jgi:hypothetical protein